MSTPESIQPLILGHASKFDFMIQSKTEANQEDLSTVKNVHAPVALSLVDMPASLYDKSIKLQEIWNKLMHQLSQSEEFIDLMMHKLENSDPFCNSLYAIEQLARLQRSPLSKVSLAILRTDYLMHEEASSGLLSLKNVEINTIASSFAYLSGQLDQLFTQFDTSHRSVNAASMVADSLGTAIKYYENIHGCETSIAVMLVQAAERNKFDQEGIVHLIQKNHHRRMLRLTWSQFREKSTFHNDAFFIDNLPISLVYFRAGYQPQDYLSDGDWEIRRTIELSNAISCPSVAMQLVGMKKAQQLIAEPNNLATYVSNQQDRELLESCFMGLYALENINNPQTAQILESFRRCPGSYVLKPQREGGGNNMTGQAAIDFLNKLTTEGLLEQTLKAYILMEKIISPSIPNTLMLQGHVRQCGCIAELGTFGAILQNDKSIEFESSAGYLLRVKDSTVTEGGVAAGYAHLGLLAHNIN